MRTRFVAAFLLCLLLANASHATLTLTTEEYPPYNMLDAKSHKPTGLAVDKLSEMMRRAGERYTIAFFPWARAYMMAAQGPESCVFSTFRNKEREQIFRWVGPIAEVDDAIFGRTDDGRKVAALTDLQAYVIGGFNDDALAKFLISQGYKVDLATTDEQNVQKLMVRHIDYWATGAYGGKQQVANAGLADQIELKFMFHHADLYLACNRSVPQYKIDQFNRILKDMERDGTNAKISRKYQ